MQAKNERISRWCVGGRGGGSCKLCGEQSLRRAGFFFSRGEVPGSCRNQHQGSADLRVRPLGIPPKRRDPTASPTAWIGNRGSRHLKQAMHPNGSTALLSTAQLSRPPAVRTSVSAPLGIPPKRRDPTGSPIAWIGNPNVDPSADTAGSTPHRHPPQPFPEGEILDSPGFAAQRLPWVGDSHNRPEPCRGSLDEWITEIGLTIGLRPREMQIETPRGN